MDSVPGVRRGLLNQYICARAAQNSDGRGLALARARAARAKGLCRLNNSAVLATSRHFARAKYGDRNMNMGLPFTKPGLALTSTRTKSIAYNFPKSSN